MSDATCTIAARGVPVDLRDAAKKRCAQLSGLSMSRYVEHLVAADCARAGLWLPEPDRVQPADTPISGSGENPQ